MKLSKITKSAGLLMIVSVFSLCPADPARAKYLGSTGRTYEIVEPDFLMEIEKKAAQVDWNKAMDRDRMKEKVKNFHPHNLKNLPKATANRTFYVDPTWTLDFDIPDGKGGILYPKGYTFNPLDYRPLNSILVVLDAGDPEQIEWFKKTPYRDDYRVKVLLSGGNYYDLMMDLDRPVFYLVEPHAERLQLQAVPSVIIQRDNLLQVYEVLVGKKEKKHDQ